MDYILEGIWHDLLQSDTAGYESWYAKWQAYYHTIENKMNLMNTIRGKNFVLRSFPQI